jgi:hypothetical protein
VYERAAHDSFELFRTTFEQGVVEELECALSGGSDPERLPQALEPPGATWTYLERTRSAGSGEGSQGALGEPLAPGGELKGRE